MVLKEKRHLGEVFKSSRKKGHAGLPLISVTLNDGLVVRDSLDRRTETNLSPEDHLLIQEGFIAYNMMRVWQGALGRATAEGLVSPAYVVLKPTKDVDSKFAEYLFKTPRMIYLFWAYSYGLTKDRLRLYYNDFARIKILLPDLSEQKKIVQILSTWDKAIVVTEQLLANSQQHKKSLMQQLLTGKKRFSGFNGKWEVVRLGNVAEIKSGGTPKSNIESYYGGGIPWVSIADITKHGKWIETTERFLTQEGLANSSARLYPPDTIMYAMYASIGECSIAKVELSSSQAILGIRAKAVLHYEYLYFYLSSLKEKIKLQGQQGTQANLNAGMVKDFKIPLPPLNEQKKIAAVLSVADEDIDALQQKLACLKQEKKALMQQLLTGKRRVRIDAFEVVA